MPFHIDILLDHISVLPAKIQTTISSINIVLQHSHLKKRNNFNNKLSEFWMIEKLAPV